MMKDDEGGMNISCYTIVSSLVKCLISRKWRAKAIGRAITVLDSRAIAALWPLDSRDLDQALPCTHAKKLYDTLRRKEAAVLSQLRTGMSRLNGYLHGIRATDSDHCQCGTARETVKHFLVRCPRYDNL